MMVADPPCRPVSSERTMDADVAALVARDADLARVVDAHGPPPVWRRPQGFATLTLQILEQQVSLGAAAAHFARLEDATGGRLTPAAVLALDDETMFAAGVSRQKRRYVRALATAVVEGDLDLEGLAGRDDDEVRASLTRLPGIGPWTADCHLLFVLGRPDVFPVGDRALQVAAAEVLGHARAPTPRELAEIAARWTPWRSTAARILWHDYLTRRGRTMRPLRQSRPWPAPRAGSA